MVSSFEKLNVWMEARDFVVAIYKATATFPVDEKFGLISQLRRASISIASNIAEGSSRKSKKDQNRFYTMAFSSTLEVLNQLIISKELNFIDDDVYQTLMGEIEQMTAMLNSLHSSIRPNS